jgi:hypothetical protein
LTNVDNTITGAGLLGNGTLTLVNDATGSIIGTSAGILTINTGTKTITNVGLVASNTGGDVIVSSAISNSGTLSANGGTLTLNGAVSGGGVATINGGELDAAGTFNENVTFTGATGVLKLANSQTYTGSVTGLSLTGSSSLDLGDIGFVSGQTTATYVDNGHATGGVLTVTNGTVTAHINLVGNYTASSFNAVSDGSGGTSVTDPPLGTQTQSFVAAMAGFAPSSGAGAASDVLAQSTSSSTLNLAVAHG